MSSEWRRIRQYNEQLQKANQGGGMGDTIGKGGEKIGAQGWDTRTYALLLSGETFITVVGGVPGAS